MGALSQGEGGSGPPYVAAVVATILSACAIVGCVVLDVDQPAWLTIAGLVCLGLAVVFAVPPFFHLRRRGGSAQGDAYYATARVVDNGVYGIVRHPQYLGYSCLILGLSLLNPHVLTLSLAVGVGILFYLQAIAEERYCLDSFGAAYADFKTRVPRFNFILGVFRALYGRLSRKSRSADLGD